MATKVLDSWALIAFFEDEPAAADVEKLLQQAADEKHKLRPVALGSACECLGGRRSPATHLALQDRVPASNPRRGCPAKG